MTHIDTGTTGAKRQSWSESSPRELLRMLVQKNPRWSRERIFDEFKIQIEQSTSKKYIDTIVEYWFANNYHSLVEREEPFRNRSARKQEELTEQLNNTIEHRAKIFLLDIMMPNGKLLRACTGAECKEFSSKLGAWLLRISKTIKPTDIVGDVLTETQIRKLYR
jgi:hypothetical protein